jgi:SNF2 family DNA or RNA helicase
LNGIIEQCAAPLWLALLQVGLVSSCAVDILTLFALVMQDNCDLVLQTVQSKLEIDRAEISFGSVTRKMIEMLSFDDEAVKASSLRVVGMIMKPVIFRSVSDAESAVADSLLSVTSAYCDILTCLFTAYFDLDGYIEGEVEQEGKNIAVLAKDDAWSKVIGAIPPLLEHEKCRAMLFHMLSTAILRFIGIEKVNEVTPPRRVSGSLDSLVERRSILFDCQNNASKALALLFIEFGLISSEEDDASTAGAVFLNCLLQALSKSPWPSICESACVLYAALGENCLAGDASVNSSSAMLQSRGLFTSMLVEGPQCLSLAGEASTFLRDPNVISACDQVLITMVVDHTSALGKTHSAVSERGHRISADEVFHIWQGIVRAKGGALQPDGAGAKPTVTTTSMRLSSSIAGAAVSWGVRDLPIKLTPIIRPLMTSLKNEESSKRLGWTCGYLARLLSLRSSGDAPPVPTNVRDKVLTNVCSVALADESSNSPSPASSTAGKNILQRIARDLDGDIGCIAPFSLILSPLKQDSVGDASESSSVSNTLQRGLVLLFLLSRSLPSSSQAYGQILSEMLHTVVNFACTHPHSRIREQAVNVACKVCESDPSRALQRIIPTLLERLKSTGIDEGRLYACSLLSKILDAAGTTICPFVRFLLPTAMSLMRDPLEECASLAASSFAALVRVSPLIEKRQNTNLGNAGPSEAEHSSNKVIDHLIHGEPLPALSLPREIQACLDKSETTLRGYQKEGIAWLHFLQSVNLNGALCDDMGVGKSLQALVGIALAHSKSVGCGVDGAVKSLVVCPSTVVGHWMNEVRKYFPDEQIFKPLMYTGPAKSRKIMLQEQLKECNLVVTSYSVLRNDINVLSSFPWEYCVLDEGHLLKNPRTATAKAARIIKSRHRLILSGTPVQNHVNELWAVFDFLIPNLLGTEAVFTKSFAKPIRNGQDSGASPEAIGTSINKLKLLHQTVLPFILRREKHDVMKELPPKVISDIPCMLSSAQAMLYQRFIESSEAKDALNLLQKGIQAAHQDADGGANGYIGTNHEQSIGKDVLKSLLYLRLLCTHPMLVAKRLDGDDEAEDVVEQLSRLDSSGKLTALKDLLQSASICADGLTAADNDQSILYARRITSDETDLSSGNVCQPTEDLEDEGRGKSVEETGTPISKCLIFAQFKQSLDIIEEYLFVPHMPSLRYLRIDGQVPPEERTKRVDRFNSDESIQVMLLTTRVGGLGLNLTGADTVIFLESDWNPFSDLQAMDRAHRIGQTKTVNVYRLICTDTIEEKIMRLQSIKMEMSKAIVNSDNSTMYSMGTDRLLDLFTFEDGQRSVDDRNAASEGSTESHLLDSILSAQEDDYLALSTENFLRGLLPRTKDINEGAEK